MVISGRERGNLVQARQSSISLIGGGAWVSIANEW